jgi:hypothetical protein
VSGGAARPVTAADLVVGDPVWVWSFGRWRRGVVTAVARIRVRVRYEVTSRPQARQRWFAAGADEPVYPGRLAEPVLARCADSACRQTIVGHPGQPEAQARAAHVASAAHRTGLPPVPPADPVAGPPASLVAAVAAAADVAGLDVVWIATTRRGIAAHRLAPAAAAAGGVPVQRWTRCGRVVVAGGRAYGQILLAEQAIAQLQVTWCPRCWPNGAVVTGGG